MERVVLQGELCIHSKTGVVLHDLTRSSCHFCWGSCCSKDDEWSVWCPKVRGQFVFYAFNSSCKCRADDDASVLVWIGWCLA